MKVCLYARVSTDDKEQNPERQLNQGRYYCKLNSHDIIGEFIDVGISGDTFYYDRPEGKKLYELIKKNRVEGIVVSEVDRFSRQSPLKILPLINSLQQQGIKFISVTEPVFNMEGEMAEPMRYMLHWFSNYFLKQHRSKVNSGMAKARQFGTKSGKAIGRERKANYERIIELYNSGSTISNIAKDLGINKSSVFYAIKLFKTKSL